MTTRQDPNGSVFIGLILTMLVFSAMGAGMLAMTTTATHSPIWTNSISKAYYLAESGFRYADSEYKNTDDSDGDGEIKDDRNALLESWHNSIFTLSSDTDKFEFKIYPYYLVTTASRSKGATSLQTKYPGEQPAGFAVPASGKLKIGSDDPYDYTYDSGTGIFIISPLQTNVSDNMDVYLIANPASGPSPITKNGNLTLVNASFFPDHNGVFRVDDGDGTVYAYKSRNGNTLQNIFNVEHPDRSFSVTVGTADNIILNPFIELHSIGIVDFGSSIETKRETVYSVPLPTNVEERVRLHDTFEDKSNWEDSTLGSHKIETIGGDKALRVFTTSDIGTDKASLIKLDWSETNTDLGLAHYSSGYYLSYDAQVKVGFDPLPVPADYYMAGLSFRQDAVATGNSYGISFLKSGALDEIPDTLVPPIDWPMIVLWQQTNAGADKKWLAYKYLVGRPVYLDTENDGWDSWSASICADPDNDATYFPPCLLPNHSTVLWHQTDTCGIDRNVNSVKLMYYGQEGSCNYNTGATTSNCGDIVSPEIDLTTATSAFLSFWSWYDTEVDDNWDVKFVQISKDGGTNWENLKQIVRSEGNPDNTWQQILIDLSSPVDYTGEKINVRFRFDARDCLNNSFKGWHIDDVTISGDFPVNEATLMVRVTEGATLKFTNGDATPIESGDIVVQGLNYATVVGDPVLESGSWTAGGNATGILILNKVNGTFQIGQDLYVGGSVLAKISSDADFFRTRDNYVKVYYGEAADVDPPNTTPLDFEKHGISRGDVQWPPDSVDDTTADNDYFTLVQWDQPATDLDSASGEALFGQGKELDAIIRLNALTSPTSGTFTASELALHTFGINSTSVYFDDFALQTKVFSTGGFLPAIQE
ncbi:hypothetical protein ACFL03_14260 [Thermodesulfobacteriota bacterium]